MSSARARPPDAERLHDVEGLGDDEDPVQHGVADADRNEQPPQVDDREHGAGDEPDTQSGVVAATARGGRPSNGVESGIVVHRYSHTSMFGWWLRCTNWCFFSMSASSVPTAALLPGPSTR